MDAVECVNYFDGERTRVVFMPLDEARSDFHPVMLSRGVASNSQDARVIPFH
ncbi:MAG: hypothetical protein ACTSVI_12780 [Promethearchaeota archaeon]